jgi:hypothetical protein
MPTKDFVTNSSRKPDKVVDLMNKPIRHPWLPLSLIVAASFAVRIAASAYCRTGTIENEGAEYARLAENLRNGVGFVRIAMPGTRLLFD